MFRTFILLFALLISINLTTASYNLCLAQVSPESQRAEQILAQGLQEKNPHKRSDAVIALSLEGARELVFIQLSDALNDNDGLVRLSACASLAALKDRRSIEPLQKALKDSMPEVSFAAAQALWDMNDPAGKEVIMAVLMGEKKNNSSYLSKQKQETMRMMKTPGGMFKFALKMGIGFVPLPGFGTGVSSVESLLKDSNLSGRA